MNQHHWSFFNITPEFISIKQVRERTIGGEVYQFEYTYGCLVLDGDNENDL